MQDFTKTVRIGTKKTYGGRYYSVYCSIEYQKDILSITGVEGPIDGGNCIGSCGQIYDHIKPIAHYAKGWNNELLDKFLEFWKSYHLNDMHAGTPEQDACIVRYGAKNMDYRDKCQLLEAHGLYEVTLPNGTRYKYGTGWLRRDVPEHVLEWLYELPNTDRSPAWV